MTTHDEHIASNLRRERAAARLSVRQVASRMQDLGYRWHANTVTRAEAGERVVSAAELAALAICYQCTVPQLYLPPGSQGTSREGMHFTISRSSMRALLMTDEFPGALAGLWQN